MWISRKTSEIENPNGYSSQVGIVSVGGVRPAVITDGETRSAEIAMPGGVVYVPCAGEEVLLERTCDDERIILAKLPGSVRTGLSEGDIFISAGGSSIHIKRNGDIKMSGTLLITGRAEISGALIVNGKACECDC